ncbi:MAG: YbjQ family protein [Flavobacteriaceae bacterium]|jgi:uncharacterized protein YbjQ (UPF0145 family)|nr:YbjQ family protein [Flavobacteriaceae bacterium]
MILTTTNSIEGFKVIEYKGIVSGIGVLMQKLKLTFNIEKYNASVADGIVKAKELALKHLEENAKQLNVNAIIGIKVDIELTASNYVTVSATGTAVNIAK